MMSWLSRVEGGSDPAVVREPTTADDYAAKPARYLTDGIGLYRSLGTIPTGVGQMVRLENCRSLGVVLLPLGELGAWRLRAVIPHGDEEGASAES
jgi:hypothetical protein